MGTVIVLSKDATMELINAGLVNGSINTSGELILSTQGGDTLNLGTVKVHGDLLGLDGDDHTQYALADGTRGDFATLTQGGKADAARKNMAAVMSFLGGATVGVVETGTVQDDGTDTATWPNRIQYQYMDAGSGHTARNVVALNEYFEMRIAPAKHNTTGLRVFVVEHTSNTDGTRSTTVPIMELMDNRDDRNSLWGLVSDGTTVVKGIRMAYVLHLNVGDAIPTGTPTGTIIVRT